MTIFKWNFKIPTLFHSNTDIPLKIKKSKIYHPFKIMHKKIHYNHNKKSFQLQKDKIFIKISNNLI